MDYIKIPRNIIEQEWYKDISTNLVYLHLLFEADEIGTVLVSSRRLANLLGLSRQNVRTAFEKLVRWGMIETRVTQQLTQSVTHRTTEITICNYDSYIMEDLQDNPIINPISNPINPINPTNPEEKNKTKKEEIPPHPPIEEKNKTKKEETNYNACEKKISDREKNEKSLRERQAAFASAVQAHAENYDEAMLRDFIDYWTEPNKSYSKMRFEQERTWELKRRLDYWERRSKQFKRISYGTTNSNGYIAPELRATQERREQEERLAVRIRQLAEEDGGGM